MNFAEVVKNNPNKYTENGQLAYSNLNNPVLELFAQIGALRNRSEDEISQKFIKAFNSNPELTTKMLFYCGNIRGGLGERRTFKIGLKTIAQYAPEYVKNNIGLIPFFNRWDTIFSLIGTPVENDMWDLVKNQIQKDMKDCMAGREISLLAKWLPSENASSKETRKLAVKVYNKLNLTPRTYRKILSKLRNYINVVEKRMSAKDWAKISYSAVPSYAMKKYSNAFKRNDTERFSQYVADLVSGKTKVNSSVLYPYDLSEKMRSFSPYNKEARDLFNAQWEGLPNYVSGENNYLVMADVSGSMAGRPLHTSTSLAAYFAERNKGYFHNLFMTFTDVPRFIQLNDDWDAYDKLLAAINSPVGYNTNLEAAFDAILREAVSNNIPNKDMPEALIIISDMEIDRVLNRDLRAGRDFFSQMKARFAYYGYTMPKLVCWNVEARNDTFLSKDPNVIYVSGSSVSSFKELTNVLKGKTALDIMIETLSNPIYDCVWIGENSF